MNINSIIVTGCGGDISIAVGRLLKEEKLANRVIGIDVRKYHAGIAFFDDVYQFPTVRESNYLFLLEQKVKKTSADLVIPITDLELAFFAENNIRQIGNAQVIMPNREAVLIGLDKLKTYEVLSNAGISMPHTWLVKKTNRPTLPCVIKKRYGHGGKDFAIIRNQEDLLYHSKNRENDIWQKYLPNDDAEYTCGLFRNSSGEIRTFILRRRLLVGLTGEGIVEEIDEIKQLLIKVANLLNLNGSINIQLRMTPKGPRIFEINPRFSSTVYFRHLLGFKDVIWSIYDNFQIKLPDYIPAITGTRIYRTFSEFILPPIEA